MSADGTGVPDQIIDQQVKRAIDAQMAAKGLTKVDCDTPDSARAAGVPQPPDFPQPPNLPELPGPKQLPGLSRSEGEAQPAGGSQPSGPRYALNSAESPAHKADLLLAYHVAIRQETQWNAFGSGWGGFPAGLGGWGTGTATATSSSIDVGTLVLNMYDPAAKQLVWAGNATKTISLSKNQDKNQRNLEKAMQKLLKDWPR
ncbi:MAG: DUF4136 domain-containing protein [Acidobacteriaceae bacterium]|nr:DUF4136 domain-containing protein [Acidobacteriaceae bacterium]